MLAAAARARAVAPVVAVATLLLPTPATAAVPRADARAAAVLDVARDRFLLEQDADARVAPASLAKMLVAIVTAERLAPNDTVTISRDAAFAEEDAVRWPEGATLRVDDVLRGLLMESSNGAAIALAERISGSVARFMALLNARALQLGATQSRFVTPSGLDAPGQYSTARDLATVAGAMLEVPWLASISASRIHQLHWPDGRIVTFRNRNRFLYRYRGAVGAKNGYTSQAGNVVAAAAIRGGRLVVTVVLNGPRVYDDAARLTDWSFARIAPAPAPARGDDGRTRFADSAARSTRAAEPPVDLGEAAPQATTERAKPESGGRGGWLLAATLLLAYVARVVQVRRRVVERRKRRAGASRPRVLKATPFRAAGPAAPATYRRDLRDEHVTGRARPRSRAGTA